jgi:hypothetical protein
MILNVGFRGANITIEFVEEYPFYIDGLFSG